MNSKDNLTILRFAHAFSKGAGTETYLRDLDNALLKERAWTIIRMYLTYEEENDKLTEEHIGLGKLVKVPLHVKEIETITHKATRKNYKEFFKRLIQIIKNNFRDHILYNKLLYQTFFEKLLSNKKPAKSKVCAEDAGLVVDDLFKKFSVDLVVMHYVGGVDSLEVIKKTIKRKIPFVVINHFSNDRFKHISVREQIKNASGVGGVSNVDVPRFLKGRFVFLADGIDTEFFDPKHTKPADLPVNYPLIFLPARITPTKGQTDLIKVVAKLIEQGLEVNLALAGPMESDSYFQSLKNLIRELGIEKNVYFLGELGANELKRWYKAAKVLAFPTYHHEGLPRVLLEAQAMEVPPISYISGGTSAGIINNKTGFLISKGSISEMTSLIAMLIIDENKRTEIGKCGREHVLRNFSLQALAARHETFYLKAIYND